MGSDWKRRSRSATTPPQLRRSDSASRLRQPNPRRAHLGDGASSWCSRVDSLRAGVDSRGAPLGPATGVSGAVAFRTSSATCSARNALSTSRKSRQHTSKLSKSPPTKGDLSGDRLEVDHRLDVARRRRRGRSATVASSRFGRRQPRLLRGLRCGLPRHLALVRGIRRLGGVLCTSRAELAITRPAKSSKGWELTPSLHPDVEVVLLDVPGVLRPDLLVVVEPLDPVPSADAGPPVVVSPDELTSVSF